MLKAQGSRNGQAAPVGGGVVRGQVNNVGAARPNAGAPMQQNRTGYAAPAQQNRTSPVAGRAQAAPQKHYQVQEEGEQQVNGNLPAVQQRGGALAQPNNVNIAEINAGVLEGLDGIGDSNRISLDGTEFEYKGRDRRERELYVVITYGKRLYQYWDENSSLCQSFDGKQSTDGLVCATCEHKRAKECKFKYEIRWLETNLETEEPEEFIFTLSTVSALEFINYVKELGKEGLAINQVVTHMQIQRRTKDSNKYSAVVFESAGLAEQ